MKYVGYMIGFVCGMASVIVSQKIDFHSYDYIPLILLIFYVGLHLTDNLKKD